MAEWGISLPTQIWYANGEIGDILLCTLQTFECSISLLHHVVHSSGRDIL